MDLANVLIWIILISFTTVFGSWYARKYDSADALFALYVGFVLFSNIAAVKIATYDLGFATYFAPAAALIFPVTFLLTDIVNEKFGRREVHRMIFLAFASQLAVAIFAYLTISLPSAPFWNGNEAFKTIIGQVPRIMVASWIAFLISENFDAYIFAWFRDYTQGRHLWARNVLSSLPAMLLDSVIFASIAFIGITPIGPLILGVTVTKWLVGLVNVPFMYLNRAILKS